ncbi:hypothetical protein ABBQ38_002173 [Trebouxia sp. C0009 RCD-2024]
MLDAKAALHKDKLSETKRAEKEAKEAHKATLQASKQKTQDAKAAERAAFKEVRAISNSTSKRAAADARQAARRDKRKAGGETCEHGVHRCRICFPIEAHK